MQNIIITIDGVSGAGKGTTAKGVAYVLGYKHLDSGKLYRGITYYLLDNNIDYNNIILLKDAIKKINFDFVFNDKIKEYEVLLNNKNIESYIRTMSVNNHVAQVSKYMEVRNFINDFLKQYGKIGGIVMDGRDIASTVFPNAQLKIFLDADVLVRAQRRQLELQNKGETISLDDIIKNLKQRDDLDKWKSENVNDFVFIDTTKLTIPEQIQLVVDKAKNIIYK